MQKRKGPGFLYPVAYVSKLSSLTHARNPRRMPRVPVTRGGMFSNQLREDMMQIQRI